MELLDTRKFTPLSGDPAVYLLNPTTVGQLNRKIFGRPATKASNKTIMLIGATGSGKTTLINGMINYIHGVEWEDNWRFKLIHEETNKTQAWSQTSEVTAYQIHHTDEFQVPYSLTIIDTPGFGDTRGIKQDKEITEKIRDFFSVKGGIDSIDAVCFVVQSALARLTHTQKYIFDAILSIFGKDIATNIIALVTFADGKSPPILEAIKGADIPFTKNPDGSPLHFKFNNSVLFDKNTEASSYEDNFDYMFWKMGKVSMNKFFTHLASMQPQSLTLTKEVLQERRQLEATVERIVEVEYEQVQGKVVEMIDTVTNCLQHLKEIALYPDPLSTPDYIDLLIQTEELEARPGFKQRIKELQEARKRAVLLKKVAKNINLTGTEKAKFIMSTSTSVF